MTLIRRIIWIILGLLGLLLVAYASFPWWARPILESGMPADWRVKSAVFNYPAWRTLSVDSLDLESPDMRVTLSQIRFDWVARELMIGELDLQQWVIDEPADVLKPDLINLPQLKLGGMLATLPFSRLQVTKINLARSQSSAGDATVTELSRFELAEVTLKSSSANNASLNFKLLPNRYLHSTQLFTIDLSHRRGEWLANTLLNGDPLVDLNYSSNAAQTQLTLQLPLQSLLALLPAHPQIESLKPAGLAEIIFSQNHQSPSFAMNLSFTGDVSAQPISQQRLNVKFNAQADSNLLPLDLTTRLTLSSDSPITLNGRLTSQHPQLQLTSRIHLEKASDHKTDEYLLVIQQLKGRLSDSGIVAKVGENQLNLGKVAIDFSHPDIEMNKFSGNLGKLQLVIDKTPFAVSASDGERLVSGNMLANLQLSNLPDAVVNGQLSLTALQVKDIYRNDKTPVEISIKRLRSDLASGTLDIAFTDSANKIANFPFKQLSGEVSAKFLKGNIDGHGNLRLNEQALTGLKFAWKQPSGKISLALPEQTLANSLLNQIIAEVIPPKTLKVSIDGGALSHHGDLRSQQPFSFHSFANLSNGRVKLGKTRVQSIGMASKLELGEKLTSETHLSAGEIIFESGLSLTNFKANVASDGSELIKITNAQLTVLKGNVHSDQILLAGRDIQSAPFKISHLSLKQLFELIDIKGLTMDGAVDVVGNISTQDGVYSIEQFKFTSTGPGTLKYNKGESLGLANTIAAKALSNFRYTEFEGEIVNASKSEVPLKIRLLGSNPDLKLDRPLEIVLNLNNQVDAKELTELLKRFFQ